MSQEKKVVNLKTIVSDKVVQIDVGSGFYHRVQSMLFDHVNLVEPDVAIKALAEVKDREPKDKWEYNLLTLLTLVYSIESAFDAAGHIKMSEIPVPEKN